MNRSVTRKFRRIDVAAFSIFATSALVGCASSDSTRLGSDPGAGYQVFVNPAAYGADHFAYDKRTIVRPQNDFKFFFKHCELIGQRAFYLQNEYGCTPP